MPYRHLACYKLMWTTACRGHDCGKLRVDDFRDPTNPRRAYNARFFPPPVTPQLVYQQGFTLGKVMRL